ncbi:putative acyltransferase [Bacteroidales bacterium Barb6XT]|nr:putative acyltransferase [Bacteroidales bacterium Barb6XT]
MAISNNVSLAVSQIPSQPRNRKYVGDVGISQSISISSENGSNSAGSSSGDSIWSEVPFDAPSGSEEVKRDVAETEDDVASRGAGAYMQADEMRLQSDRETNDLILQWKYPVVKAGETLDPPRKILPTRLAVESFPVKMEGQNLPSGEIEMAIARIGAEGIILSDNIEKYIVKLKTDSKFINFVINGSILPFADDKGTIGINESGKDKFRFNKIYAGTGGVKSGGDVMPDEDNSKSIGSASFRWKKIFAGTDGISTSGDILPLSNDSISIGSESLRFKNIYFMDLDVKRNAKIGGKLEVTGDSTLKGKLDVTGKSTLTGDLEVKGDSTMSGIIVNGDVAGGGGIVPETPNTFNVGNESRAFYNVYSNFVTALKNLTAKESLIIGKDSFLKGNTTVNGNITVGGNASISGNLTAPIITSFNQRITALENRTCKESGCFDECDSCCPDAENDANLLFSALQKKIKALENRIEELEQKKQYGIVNPIDTKTAK